MLGFYTFIHFVKWVAPKVYLYLTEGVRNPCIIWPIKLFPQIMFINALYLVKKTVHCSAIGKLKN